MADGVNKEHNDITATENTPDDELLNDSEIDIGSNESSNFKPDENMNDDCMSRKGGSKSPVKSHVMVDSTDSRVSIDSRPTSSASSRSPVHRGDGDKKNEGGVTKEERFRHARVKLAEERQRKFEELREQQKQAQENREKQQEVRRQKIDELRRREEERRASVEERRKTKENIERTRREAIIQKSQERVARYEAWKATGRTRGGVRVYGFGSRAPREICQPLEHSKRSSSHSTLLRRSPNDSDSDCVRPQRRAVSACSVRRHCCVDIKPSGLYPGATPPSKLLSASTSVLYHKRSPEFASVRNLSAASRHDSLLAPSGSPPHRPKSTMALNTSMKSRESDQKPTVRLRESDQKTRRKTRPASIAGPLPSFVSLENKATTSPRSRSTDRLTKEKTRTKQQPNSEMSRSFEKRSHDGVSTALSKKSLDRLSTPKAVREKADVSSRESTPSKVTIKSSPAPSIKKLKPQKDTPEKFASPAKEISAEDEQSEKKSSQDIIQEEYKNKLAENRRLARVKAGQEAEFDRQKQEELERLEEERLRKEEEDHRRFIEEQTRLAEEARKAEDERLQQAIEAEEKRKRAEAEKLEEERLAKEEADRKAKLEAEKLEQDRQERAKREEEERTERKKRLEMIMKRVKTDSPQDGAQVDSPAKSLTNSPTKSLATSSSETSPDETIKGDAEKDSQLTVAAETPKFKSPLLQHITSKTMENGQAGEPQKFKSPLLQNMMSKKKTVRRETDKEDSDSEIKSNIVIDRESNSTDDEDKDIDTSIAGDSIDVQSEDSGISETKGLDNGDHKLDAASDSDLKLGTDTEGNNKLEGVTDSGNNVTAICDNKIDTTTEGVNKVVVRASDSNVTTDSDNKLHKDTEASVVLSSESACNGMPQNGDGLPVTDSSRAVTSDGANGSVTEISFRKTSSNLAVSDQSPNDGDFEEVIDLSSIANKSLELTSQHTQQNIRNSAGDIIHSNHIDSSTPSEDLPKTSLIAFEESVGSRQDVTDLLS